MLSWIHAISRPAVLGAAIIAIPFTVLAQDAARPTPVTVVTVKQEDVRLTSELPGRVVASGVAEVRPQVSGIIVERLFEEGGKVEKGDPMYRINSDIYEAQVQRSQASVEQAKASLTAAEKEATRAAELLARKVTSQQVVDDAVGQRDAARAALLVAQAQLRSDEISLDHTIIRAPITGEVGRTLTTQGALVSAQQTDPLAIIRQIDSVYVDVTASAADVVRWRRNATELGQRLSQSDLAVQLTLADGEAYNQTGMLHAAEPHVDPLTGVSVLRLVFPNPDQLLLPGMYIKATVPTEMAEGVVLAPQQGVTRDRRGQPTALVVNAENVVEQRILTVLGTRGNDWIVSEGLNDGDKVIVAGLQKIGQGSTVAPQERAAETGENDTAKKN